MCAILKTPGRKAKRTKFVPEGKALAFKVILMSFGAFMIFPIFSNFVSQNGWR